LEKGGMYSIYNPMGAFTVCGIIYLIICMWLVIKKKDHYIDDEVNGLIIVVCLWVGLGGMFFFFRGHGREVTMIKGKEITRQEIVCVLECIEGKRNDVGSIEGWKQNLIIDSLKTKEDRSEYDSKYDDVKVRWVSTDCIGHRLPSDYDYYYKYAGREKGWLPKWFYHPIMFVWCPLISILFSRPFWFIIFLQRLKQ